MSTVVRVLCTGCRVESDVTPNDLILLVVNNQAAYVFTCPACCKVVRHPAPWMVYTRLCQAGLVPQKVPAEAREVHDGPPLTFDDWVEFACSLSRDDLLSELT